MRAHRPILACGLDDGREKIARHYAGLGRILGSDPLLYAGDQRGFTGPACERHGLEWVLAPRGKLRDLARFLGLLLRRRPAHVELYHQAQSDWVHLGYCLLTRALGIPLVTVCRGGELLHWDRHSRRRQRVFRLGFRLSRLIVLKEPYMAPRLERLGIPLARTLDWHNHVPVHPEEPAPTRERPGVLFLNSFKPIRRPDIVVEVGLALAERHPDARFLLAGQRAQGHDGEVRRALEERVARSGHAQRFEFHGFIPDPERLYARAALFLLPAEHVFLNYALLEAMERGCVPVISKAPRVEEIVEDGRDGRIVETTVEAFTRAVDELLSDPERLEEMSRAARRRVRERFELDAGLRILAAAYRERVWTRARAG